MPNSVQVVEVEWVEDCGIIVSFSDGTLASYTSEELAALRPYRAPAELQDAN